MINHFINFIITLFLFLPNEGKGQSITYHSIDKSTFEIHFNIDFPIISGQIYAFNQLFDLTTLAKGAPALPYFTTQLQLRPNSTVNFEIIQQSTTVYNEVEVQPSIGSVKANKQSEIIPLKGDAYFNNQFYPANIHESSQPFWVRNQQGITLFIYPFQYNGTNKTLQVHHQLIIKGTYSTIESPVHIIPTKSTVNPYSGFFINTDSEPSLKFDALNEKGDMLIIHPEQYGSSLEEFVAWKTQNGIKTYTASLDSIGNTSTQIKNFVQQFYTNHPNLVYLLLAADHDLIPAFYYGNSQGEEIYSDSYYGQLIGNDLIPELFVGRFSGTAHQIQTMAQRSIEYEKNRSAGSWIKNAIGIASDEGGAFGDLNEADYVHMRNIRDSLWIVGYQAVYEFYEGNQGELDAPGNPTPADILNAINQGVGLINYTGHGDFTIWNTSNFTSNHVYQLTNYHQYPFIVSVACNNGNFIYGNCLAEEFLRAKKNDSLTGAIGFCGSSILMAWAQPMRTQDNIVQLLSNTDELTKKKSLGGLFYNAQAGMLQSYNNDLDAQEVMKTWILFGDPSLVFATEEPAHLSVNHASYIDVSANELAIECSEVNTQITLTHENTILTTYNNAQFNSNAHFVLPTVVDSILLTVSKQNYKPYQVYVRVIDTTLTIVNKSLEMSTIFPNPTKDNFTISLPQIDTYLIQVIDASGKIVKESQEIETKLINYNLELLEAGIYIVKISNPQQHKKYLKIIKQP